MNLRGLWRRLRGGRLTRKRAAASIAIGLFIGSLPLYGLHFPLCVLLCLPFRLDVVTAYVAANISNPLVAPFLIASEIEVGSLLIHGAFVPFDIARARALGISGFVAQAALGSLFVGAALAAIGAALSLFFVRREETDESKKLDAATERTLARYREAPRADRFYVSTKLQSDPIGEVLASLPEKLGDVLDIASGRGQLALLLLELGKAESVRGVDWDERKSEVATKAARGDAQFLSGDLSKSTFEPADTVLLVDVLHALSVADQDALIEAAARATRPGGRVIVRDIDPNAGWRSRLTIFAEKIAARISYNRSATIEPRAVSEIIARFTERGLSCRVIPASAGTPLSNVLILAERAPQAPAALRAS